MDCLDYVFERLSSIKESDVVFSTHAQVRMKQRQIDAGDVIKNILNPIRLVYAARAESKNDDGEGKFDCYFAYSKNQCHKYVLLIKDCVLVVTVIKINRRWQRIVEKKLNK